MVVLNGDTVTEEPLVKLLESHQQRISDNPSHLLTMVLVPFVSPYTIFKIGSSNAVLGIEEERRLPYWINAGVYVMDRKISDELPELGNHETLTFSRLAGREQILGVKSTEFWIGIDSFKELGEAEDHLNNPK